MKAKLIKTDVRTEVRIWQGDEPIKPSYRELSRWQDYHTDLKQYLSSYKSYPVRSEDEEGFKWAAWEAWCNARGKAPVVGINHNYDFNRALSQGIEIPSERVGFEEVDIPVKYTNGEYSRTIQMVKHAILLPQKESLSFPEMNKKDLEQHDYYMNHCQVCGKHKNATLLTEDKEGEGQEDGWVSVDERLPEKAFKDVLVYSRLGIVGLGFYDSEFLRMNSNQSHIGNITHWMPLPKPPIK